jgi:hypothetical protein
VSSFPPAPTGPPDGAAAPGGADSRDGAPGSGSAFALGHRGVIPAAARWGGRAELRADLRAAVTLAVVLLLCGGPAGLLWWWLAPRADFRVTDDGPVAIGRPSQELSVADDSVFVLILAGLGVLAGTLAWRLRRRRGVATMIALAVGTAAAAGIAWRLGEALGPAPTEAELSAVGGVVTTPLDLAALPALAVAPFSAVLAYVAATLLARGDDLGRTGTEHPAATAPQPAGGEPAGEEPVDAGAR